MLRYLAELEIIPGTEILIVSKAPFDGPITLRIGKELHSIGPALASQIMVEPIVDLEAPAH
jgi:DtxR family Mn-dependent transcriptional regulator